MGQCKFVAVTNTSREYSWKSSYTYNLSGKRDEWDEIGTEQNFMRGEIGVILPRVVGFYNGFKSGEKDFSKLLSVRDLSRESPIWTGVCCLPEGHVPVILCKADYGKDLLRTNTNIIKAEYFTLPLRQDEFRDLPSDNFDIL